MFTYLELAYKAVSAIDVTIDCKITEGKLLVDCHVEIELPDEVKSLHNKLTSNDS